MAQSTSRSSGSAGPATSREVEIDSELVGVATRALLQVPANDGDHTVAAAARSRSGDVFAGINVFHFTGGPCAELVALGVAAAQGVLAADLLTMVAVRRDVPDDDASVQVLNPCGRCRQVLLDYNPNIHVIAKDPKGALSQVRIMDLLPLAYVYGDAENEGGKEGGGMKPAVEVALA